MASHITGTLCRQARSIGRLQTLSQNHFVSQPSLIQLCLLRNFATKKMGLPRVFFDMAIDNEPAGRFIVEVSEYSTEINLFFSHKFHELHNSFVEEDFVLFFFSLFTNSSVGISIRIFFASIGQRHAQTKLHNPNGCILLKNCVDNGIKMNE